MKKLLLIIILISSMQSFSQMSSSASSDKPKVRAITGFVRLDPANFQAQIADVLIVLRKAQSEFQARGYEVESCTSDNPAAG